ncbi:ABC transporter permease subunit [Streptomyces ficellus]|uniref:ABC transporter permease subunit n=1 Tax=Streptomyces ficellus TaxID=1977088 RepID=A0ABT7ZEE8_9ACTN|nr:ABC transporter permease subunit [Streptomyces ficellus]MDN3297386.1 ABC transporter permease subunit [Streptomyces ficellus]
MSLFTPTGSRWVVARQHRYALWAVVGLVVAAAAVMISSRVWADSAVEALRAVDCTVSSTEQRCFQPARDYTDAIWAARHLIEYAALGMMALPAIVGAFVAGPLIAREMEAGTYKLAWTQSVSPARWLAAKLTVPVGVVIMGTALLTLIFSWSWSTGPAQDFPTYWYEPTMYASIGTVPTAYAVMGLALGALVGLLVRRTVTAMSATALIIGGVLLAMSQVRVHLWPISHMTSLGEPPTAPPSRTWRIEEGALTPSGERMSLSDCFAIPPAQQPALCKAPRGDVTHYLDHHPSSHFWPIQLVESGIVLVLAAAATYAAFRVLRRSHA